MTKIFEEAALLLFEGKEQYPCYAVAKAFNGYVGYDFNNKLLRAWHNLFQPFYLELDDPHFWRPLAERVWGHWGDHLGKEGCILALLFAQAMFDEGDLVAEETRQSSS